MPHYVKAQRAVLSVSESLHNVYFGKPSEGASVCGSAKPKKQRRRRKAERGQWAAAIMFSPLSGKQRAEGRAERGGGLSSH